MSAAFLKRSAQSGKAGFWIEPAVRLYRLRTGFFRIRSGAPPCGNPEVKVPLLEVGGSEDVAALTEACQWPLNLGSERDWAFRAQPNPRVSGRSIAFSMRKVVGGGSPPGKTSQPIAHTTNHSFARSVAQRRLSLGRRPS
jgi:hypothetical protein